MVPTEIETPPVTPEPAVPRFLGADEPPVASDEFNEVIRRARELRGRLVSDRAAVSDNSADFGRLGRPPGRTASPDAVRGGRRHGEEHSARECY